MTLPLDSIIYVGLLEILKDESCYHISPFGLEYNSFTDAGKEALLKYIEHMAPIMQKHHKEELTEIAKQLTLTGLNS